MKSRTANNPTKQKTKYGNPIPVRFKTDQMEGLKELGTRTSLKQADLIRAAVKYCVPRFLNGEINLTNCG